ncbi:sulfur oxidation c-type cytochrome SoxA [Halothiobacillus sp.]|jgi:sulfur-oxidizing protein SoxA|uniref:sulfur oxidation c-type cytochrome SoxA n=1 Tax=Halothiobacillus sp. TaxID=1891311 RepID=UPI002984BCE7|nr:sulfur oxidation c-type cytochrome SoxA [Halothiobacillus sp.]MDY0147325.1 sulfur oxidation c-type cytochrome SoxA [Halothiobacillus sp.]
MRQKVQLGLAVTLISAAMPAFAANPVNQGNDAWVEMQQRVEQAMPPEANPGAFTIDDGKALFFKKAGPNNKDLSTCDFGLGPGVVKDAYAQLPRYFPDTGRVETLEGRLLTCMEKIQGFTPEQVKEKFLMPMYKTSGEEDGTGSDLVRLTTYIAAQSNGEPFKIKLDNAEEKKSYHLGEYMFFHRWGEMDLNCATCHAYNERTVRGVPLPNLLDTHTAGKIAAAFPAYVIKDGTMRTQWWRNERCVMAMRLPWIETGSPLDAALTLFLRVQATKSDVKINIPGVKPRA